MDLVILVHLNTDNGEKLWTYNTYISMLAPPVTYEIDGEQYVVILAGTGGPRITLVSQMKQPQSNTVTLGSYWDLNSTQMSSTQPTILDRTIPEQPELVASKEDLIRGEQLYNVSCGRCHGGNARSGGVLPDLRMMNRPTHHRI